MRIVALASGSGTTLQNLIDRGFPIVGVAASKAGIVAIDRAHAAKIPTIMANAKDVFAAIAPWQPDLVCLCGWLKLLTIPAGFERRVLNIHPSLLPKFGGAGMYGIKVHQAVLDAGETESGCTVHFADNTYDTGEIIVQKRVPVLLGDTAESLAKRVFAAECEAYPEAIRLVERSLTRQGQL